MTARDVLLGLVQVAMFVFVIDLIRNGLKLMAHRKEGISKGQLMVNGLMWFDADNFEPSGHPLHQKILRRAGLFIAVMVIVVPLLLFIP